MTELVRTLNDRERAALARRKATVDGLRDRLAQAQAAYDDAVVLATQADASLSIDLDTGRVYREAEQ